MNQERYLKAIDERCSRRTYITKDIEMEKVNSLQRCIKNLNEMSGLNLQLQLNGPEIFKGFSSSYGMLKGVGAYFALVGSKDDKDLLEKVGYFGEILALEATALGLGTCWIGGTYDRKLCAKLIDLKENEELVAIITVGYTPVDKTFKEKMISKLSHRKTKTVEEMYHSNEEVPNEFINGMKAVQKAPSALNKQPVKFHFTNGVVTTSTLNSTGYEKIDLGIAKLHFEIGTGLQKKFEIENGQSVYKF